MEPREQRGILIAATKQIHQHGDCWIVPSQSGKGVYAVKGVAQTNPEWSCPDYDEAQVRRRASQQDGHCDGQRNAVQGALSQHRGARS